MVRLAELMGTFAIATDHGMGMPPDRGLRAMAVLPRLASASGMEREASDAYYLTTLRYAGCTADSHLAASAWGDEVGVRGALYGADFGAPADLLPRLARAVARGKPRVRGVIDGARAIAGTVRLFDTGRSHCEVGDRLAERIGFGAPFRAALFQTFERWDGKGWTEKLRGEAIAPAMRLVHVADEIERAHRVAGVDGAAHILRSRARRSLDPAIVEGFVRDARGICAPLDATSAWTAALDAEPGPAREADERTTDLVLESLADFADLRSHYTRGHSRAVARVAAAAARRAGLAERAGLLARAGLVHDVGRVAVSVAVWDKVGVLTDEERERVRLHAYAGERILSRAPCLAAIADVAGATHERLDGSGYHRRLSAGQCTAPARLLAAADVLVALGEARPHRPAFVPARTAEILRDAARAGALCPDAVRAVLDGDAPPPERAPGALTARELEVLRLLARGMTNKEIASTLDVSVRTAGHHVEHVFEKLGVTTRAAAAVVAMQRGLAG